MSLINVAIYNKSPEYLSMVLKGICCWGTEYCKCEILGMTRNQNVKLAYLFLLLLTLAGSTIIGHIYNHSQLYSELLGCDNQPDDVQEDNQLFKQSAVRQECVVQELSFRWLLAVSLLHLTLMLLMVMRNQLSKTLNEGAWFLKIIFITFFGFVNLFIMPMGLINYLHMISAYISIFWYVIQSLVIIDLIYAFDNFFNQIAENTPKFHLVKAIASILFTIAAIYLNVMSYISHQHSQFMWIPIVNSVLLVTGLLAVLLRTFRGNNLLVYSLVMIGSNTMGYFLRMREEQFEQSIYPYIQGSLVLLTLVGTLGSGSNKVRTKKSSVNEILCLNTSKDEEDNRYVSSNKWITYHYMFFAICLMLPCILNQHAESLPEDEQSMGWGSMFVYYRVGSWIIFYLVYIWTLVASKIYEDRDFNQLQHYFKEFQLN